MEDPIVISGMSGRFPQCDSVDELHQALMEEKDLVSDNHGRWPKDFYGLSNRAGVIEDIESFDNEFFGIPPRQADGLDPRTRMLLETTFEAIIDAGVHPMDIRGSKTGVFIGMNTSRGNDSVFENKLNFTRLGRSMAMTAGMIAFVFDLRGPSYALDTACSSSLYAFCQAFRALKGGECDAAIVCGASIVLDPYDSLEYKTMNILSPSGKCQFLDEKRDGFVKSESVVVTYLQKSKDARRIYATVKGCGTNTDGFKIEGVTKPSAEMQRKLLESIYEEFKINPLDVTYVEAHGTGTKVGDAEEVLSLADFFCKVRREPLLIGSVKTNIGHSEMSSGITSLTKVIASMEHEVLPPIIHLNEIGSELAPILEGKLKPVLEKTSWNNGLIGVNSFGVGGTNSHVVLEPNLQNKETNRRIDKLRLVKVAARNLKGVENFFDLLKRNSTDLSLISMVDNIFKDPIRNYNHRGYIILGEGDPVCQTDEVLKDGNQVWYIFAGIGSQWPSMGRDLMKLEHFKMSMEECASALQDFGIDLIDIVTNGNKDCFKDVVNCFIGIVAISICLVDLLKFLDIVPDGMIGHSVGEVCCAYTDGLISKREAMLIAHARGVALKNTPSTPGILAVVGMTSEEAAASLPPDLSIACYNCIDNLTISGPTKSVNEYVNKIKADGKFAEVIQGANMAYHSKYILKAGEVLEKLLEPILKEEKTASEKWITSSTGLQETKDDENGSDSLLRVKHSAGYHGNNLVNPVYFQNAMSKVPKDAIVIEMSPKGLLQTIIRRNLGTDAKILHLSSETSPDNLVNLLSSIGKLHLAGLNPHVSKFFSGSEKILKVGRGTPSLAPLVEWQRTMKCEVAYYNPQNSFGESIVVDVTDPDMKYLEGHVVEGKTIYPVMGYVYLAWEIFARLNRKPVSEVPVVIENVKIRRMTLLPRETGVIFNINIFTSTGEFEISEGDAVVCDGKIRLKSEEAEEFYPNLQIEIAEETVELNQDDVYYKLKRLGFQYKNHFKAIMNRKGYTGTIRWCDYWVPFLDAMIHFTGSTSIEKNVFLPESIGRVIIDPVAHLKLVEEKKNEIPLQFDKDMEILKCGRIEIRDLQLIELAEKKSYVKAKLEKYKYIPYNLTSKINLRDCLHLVLQIVMENIDDFSTIKILELNDDKKEVQNEKGSEENELANTLRDVLSEEVVMKTIHDKHESHRSTKIDDYNLVVMHKELENVKDFGEGFVLMPDILDLELGDSISIISKYSTDYSDFVLVRKKKDKPEKSEIVAITTESFDWVDQLRDIIRETHGSSSRVYLVSEKEAICGAMGLFNCLRYEDNGSTARLFFIIDDTAAKFSLDTAFYKEQLEKDLRVNVYKNSSWGSYRFLPYQRVEPKLHPAAHAEVGMVGDFSRIKMFQNFPFPKKSTEKVHVYYAGMNFKDVLIANGILRMPGPNQNNFEVGYEYAGRRSDGQRVFGVVRYHAFATEIDTDSPYWIVPDSWSLEEAASVPVIYITLYYAFKYKTKLEPGKSILIHSASGGVGMAAIQLALNHKCTIFATVGSDEKKQMLMKQFPTLKESHIFNSRNNSFELGVKKLTRGRGVDYVLNFLTGDLFNASLRCVASNGHFVEIGKTEFLLKSKMQSGLLLKSTSIHAISIDEIMLEQNRSCVEEITKIIERDLEKGLIKPIPHRQVYKIEEMSEAFKLLQSAKHTGKVILQIRDEENDLNAIPVPIYVPTIPKLYFNPKKSYVVTGGLGGLGLELALLLRLKGAKYIWLNSRSRPQHGYQFEILKMLESWGAKVELSQHDTSNFKNAELMLEEVRRIRPVGGIFNLAMVNKDAALEDQTLDNFREVFKPKGLVTKNLDILSRKYCPGLDHFVVFSSITCGKGNLGQTNYGFANSTMERIIDRRNEDGLPGLAIEWGPIADVGYFAKKSDKEGVGFYVAQPVVSYYEVLQEFLLNNSGILASSLLKDFIQTIQPGDSLLESVLKLFGITNKDKVKDDTTLLELGMDSLMGFEIKQYIYREHDIDISVKELRGKTIREIKEIDAKRMAEQK